MTQMFADVFSILSTVNSLTIFFVPLVKIFVNFVVKYPNHKVHKGLHKGHKVNDVVMYKCISV